jgi:putative chitinase
MNITLSQLELMIPGATDRNIEKFYAPIKETLSRYQINTRLRIAAFIAQIAHESGSLHYVEEIASGHAYTDRRDLGNMDPAGVAIAKAHDQDTGPFYRGRGLIQITGYYNYLRVGNALNIDCVNTPQLLTDPLYAALSAGWFWVSNGRYVDGENLNCNELADLDYFTLITRVVTGGTSGLTQRLKFYRNNCKVLIP